VENGDASGLPAGVMPKIRIIMSFPQDMEREEELFLVTTWKAHRMTGDRKRRLEPVRHSKLAHHVPD